MANTSIRIKRSSSTGTPASLLSGEFAYSYQSNTLFIGTSDGTGVVNVGGQYYTSQIDSATDAGTGSTLVRRDASGNASFNYVFANNINSSITGNANTATQFQTDRYIDISGGDVVATPQLYNGTANATLSASLSTVSGLSAGTYGGVTTVPVVTVAANGRIMAIANSAAISTSLSFIGDTGTDTLNLATDTLDFEGGSGVITTVSNNKVSFAVDNTTVLRTNTVIALQKIDGSIEVSGNLTVLGNTTTINVETLNISDPLIFLAANNYSSDIVDIGFVGNYNDGAVKHAGVVRHAGTKEFYVFDDFTGDHTGNVIDISDPSFRVANLHANLISQYANVETLKVTTLDATNLTLSTDLTVPNGGTGASSFTNGAILVGAGTGALTTLANSTFTETGSGAANNTISSLTVDAYGRTTAATYSAISGLTVAQGGTGVSSFGAGQIIVGDGTNGLKQLANVTYTQTGTLTTANTVSAITVDDYGRVSALTSSAIGIDANQITGGTLGVSRGGTGQTSFTAGQLVVGDGTNGLKQLANTGTAGTYGSSTQVPVITTDAYGRVSGVTTATISTSELANGSYYLAISSTDGTVSSNGSGFLLKNGARIKDTVGDAVAFGQNAGSISQGQQAVAIGDSAGYNTQGDYSVAIGYGAGNQNQSQVAVAIGLNAGMVSQGYNGIAIGNSAGASNQGTGAIALGYASGSGGGNYSVAIGYQSAAGNTSAIGANAIALGYKAGYESAYAGSIILNASGNNLSSSAAGLYIDPVRYTASQDATYDGLMFYNSSTKEARYSYSLDGGSF
jgi:hypothetical protein